MLCKYLSVCLAAFGLVGGKSCDPVLAARRTLKYGCDEVGVETVRAGGISVLRAGVGLGKENVNAVLHSRYLRGAPCHLSG